MQFEELALLPLEAASMALTTILNSYLSSFQLQGEHVIDFGTSTQQVGHNQYLNLPVCDEPTLTTHDLLNLLSNQQAKTEPNSTLLRI